MIYDIKTLNDPMASYLKDDPVRPHIPHEQRFGANRRVLALTENDTVSAVVCAKLCKGIPSTEQELLADESLDPDTAVFYTIWSYKAGAGRQLILDTLQLVRLQWPNVTRFVTLSPVTTRARRFHLRNGACVFRINTDTVNYEYI